MVIGMFFRVLRLLCIVLITVCMLPSSGRAADYRLQPGDVLSLMIVGIPELDQEIRIETDGTAWFPLIGGVGASDISLEELRGLVSSAYAEISIPFAGESGALPQLIQPDQVHVAVATYLPVYVFGDMLQARALDFRPGLTVLQALTFSGAGGLEESQEFEVRQRLQAVLVDLATVNARIWNLKSTLGTATEEDYARIFVGPDDSIREIAAAEKASIEAAAEERDRELRLVAEDIRLAEQRLESLLRQREVERESEELDREQGSNMRLASSAQLAELRRAELASASRVLQIETAIEEVRSELATQKARAEILEQGELSDVWSELAERINEASSLRAEAAILRSTAVTGPGGADTTVVVTRRGEILSPPQEGVASMLLEPGDVISVALSRNTADPQRSAAE